MRKQWKIKPIDETKLPNPSDYPQLISKLLALRGLTEEQMIKDFLEPDYAKLHDPFLFGQMQKAVNRIWQSVQLKEKITIYADYDADAITAAAVVFQSLKKLGGIVDCYIPDRFSEGYGVNAEAVKKIAESGSRLIVTVDCGTNSVLEAQLAKSLGIDLIVTDHHEITGKLPEAFTLINPKNKEDLYPFPFLTGVGVAFKLVQGLMSRITDHGSRIVSGWEKWLLDLVAIGTVADCQSLTGENRILVSYGLKVLAKTRSVGLKKLMEVAGIDGSKLDTYALGFMIAPRINAAGRIKHADLAFRLLISEDKNEASDLTSELNELNQHRQQLTERILSEARSQLELISDKKVLLAYGADWPKGVVGLVAGRLVEEYGRPVLVLRKEELLATGSGRSTSNFDLIAALNSSKDLLVRFGGHTQAAGFTLPSEHIGSFHQKLLEYVEALSVEFEPPLLEIDSEIWPEDINWENYDLIKKFSPFGVGNPKPKFVSYDCELVSSRIVGATNKHVKLQLKLGSKLINAIAFGQAAIAPLLSLGKKLDIVFELQANEWNGSKELELKIIDMKLHG